jgi:signal transduction histidine kinase
MDFIPTLFPFQVSINKPHDFFGWLGLLLFLFAIGRLIQHWKERVFQYRSGKMGFFILLLIATPFASMFLGFQPDATTFASLSDPVSTTSVFLIFSAIPWMLAAGFLGILPAMIFAGISGIFLSLWQTHNLYTVPELILLALIFGYAIRQNFRTPFFKYLRHPIGSALFLAVTFPPIFILTGFFSSPGEIAIRLDEALTQTWPLMLTRGMELVVAGIFCEFIIARGSKNWFVQKPLIPSPIEQSLQLKFLFATVPFLLGLLISLAVSSWVMAKDIALQLSRESLSTTVQTMGTDLPVFVHRGEDLLKDYSSSKLITSEDEQRLGILQKFINDSSFFHQYFLVNGEGELLISFPNDSISLTDEEKIGLALTLQARPAEIYALPGADGDCLISFISPIKNKDGEIIGALLGRTNYASNPDDLKLFAAINTFERSGGDFIVTQGGFEEITSRYEDIVISNQQTFSPDGGGYFEFSAPSGAMTLVYFQSMADEGKSVLLHKPYEQILRLTLRIAFPLLLALFLFVAAAIISLVYSLNRVSGSLRYLSDETSRIARGELGSNVPVTRVDEVGQLGKSFEQMRSSLRLRMEELNRLLAVSKGVASSLEISKSIQAVLKAALDSGASAARVVLVPDVTLDSTLEDIVSFSIGPLADIYAYFDKPLFESMRHQEVLIIPKPSRMHRLSIPEDLPKPSSLIARALLHEDKYFGAIWAAYEQSKDFSDEEMRYFDVLAGQAALAAANASLFCSTEVGRQRLDAVLSSAPEPVMVFNEINQLLLMNPAARKLDFLISSSVPGAKLEDVINNRELITLIKHPDDLGTSMREIHLQNKLAYQAIVSPVFVEKQIMGKVCLLREVTQYKQLDALKSEFVSTVSHDLRSPLTMLKGYTTMLPMVGEMNEQQREYLRKISNGIDGMTHLVNNLLDLGRIEAGVGLKLEYIQPASIIEKVVKALQPQAAQKNIQVSYHSDEIPGTRIQADPALLQQALFNIIENAIRFNNVGGKVDIKRTESQESILIEVKDTGIGIAPIDLNGIFDRFKLAGSSDQRSTGTGLGLTIVKSIVEKHNGRVWAESQLGKGSIFYLELPIRNKES